MSIKDTGIVKILLTPILDHLHNSSLPVSCFIILFPTSNVKCAVPFNTMSIIVLNALADSLSVGDMKFPAALFITTLGKPTYNIIEITLGNDFSAA